MSASYAADLVLGSNSRLLPKIPRLQVKKSPSRTTARRVGFFWGGRMRPDLQPKLHDGTGSDDGHPVDAGGDIAREDHPKHGELDK